MPSGKLCEVKVAQRHFLDAHSLVGALHREGAPVELDVVLGRLEQVRGHLLRLLHHPLGSIDYRGAADRQRTRAVGYPAPFGDTWVSPCRTSMSSNGTPSWSAAIWLHAVSCP